MSEMILQESDGQGTEQCFSLYELWECKSRDRDESKQVRGFQSRREEEGDGSGVIAISCIKKKQMAPSNFTDQG